MAHMFIFPQRKQAPLKLNVSSLHRNFFTINIFHGYARPLLEKKPTHRAVCCLALKLSLYLQSHFSTRFGLIIHKLDFTTAGTVIRHTVRKRSYDKCRRAQGDKSK